MVPPRLRSQPHRKLQGRFLLSSVWLNNFYNPVPTLLCGVVKVVLDLAELDPLTPDLDLSVLPLPTLSDEGVLPQLSVQVASFVKPLRRKHE